MIMNGTQIRRAYNDTWQPVSRECPDQLRTLCNRSCRWAGAQFSFPASTYWSMIAGESG